MRRKAPAIAIAGAALVSAPRAEAGPTLDAVKARGQLVCGVAADVLDFTSTDSQGRWNGLGVDISRATAAAIFGRRPKGEIRRA